MERVFVTGGTGFVGKRVVRALLAHGLLVRCLVRPGSEEKLRGFESIDRVPGDVLHPEGLVPSAEGCGALVHLVGIIRERRGRGVTFDRLHTQATQNMLDVARRAGIRRYVHMSALGTRPDARSRYHQTKWQAEEAVRSTTMDWTIFRPSIIFGRGDEFISMLAGMIKRLPVVPVLGDGRYRLQPVAVEHVAEGFARALTNRAAVGQTYEVAGPMAYSFVEILDKISAAVNRGRVRTVHVPLGPLKMMTAALQWMPLYPVTLDQIAMLEEESVTDPSRFYGDFGITAEPFDQGLRRVLAAS